MKYFGNGLSQLHKELNAIIRKADKLIEAKQLFFELHSKLHLSSMAGTEHNEVDSLLYDLTIDEYNIMPTWKDETIAWVLARRKSVSADTNKQEIYNSFSVCSA